MSELASGRVPGWLHAEHRNPLWSPSSADGGSPMCCRHGNRPELPEGQFLDGVCVFTHRSQAQACRVRVQDGVKPPAEVSC